MADGCLRARTMAGAVVLCWPTLRLTQVSLPARTRPHSVLLCGLAPCLSSTAQPDLRLHCVHGRRLSDAALGATFNGYQLAARGGSMATRKSSRRRPWPNRGVASLAVEGRTRAPDDGLSSSMRPAAAWSVHPDP